MIRKITLSIPEPCHEDWQKMTVVEKGKFCNVCQKNVFDFTNASDREIIDAFNKNNKLCGRFLNTQLDREIVKPKEKSTIWLATTSAIISFIGLKTNEIFAQEKPKVEQTDAKNLNVKPAVEKVIEGYVLEHETNKPVENVMVTIKNKPNLVYTDSNGKYIICAAENDVLYFSKKNMGDEQTIVHNSKIKTTYVKVVYPDLISLGGATAIGIRITPYHRTFFGKIFYKIGKWFK